MYLLTGPEQLHMRAHFSMADYGLVGDYREVLPILTDRLAEP